jgi:hypothetical protein
MEQVPEIHTMPTERMPVPDVHDVQEIKPRPQGISAMLRDYLDWLQWDIVQVDKNVIAGNTRLSLAYSEITMQVRHVKYVLVAIAVLLLGIAALLFDVIYLLGMIVGHVR